MDLAQIRRDIINRVIGIEGEYVNDSRDSGGATKYGITAATARQYGIHDVSAITVDTAFDIYTRGYWDKMSLDHVVALSADLAEELFEQAVNMGETRPTEWLQRMLNVLNASGQYYADIKIDREMGEKTIAALTAFVKRRGKRGIKILVNGLNAYQSAFYFDLAGRREKDEAFEFGWQANRVRDTEVSAAEFMHRPAHEETPPNLPLSGEEQESAVSLHPSPDKGRQGGVSPPAGLPPLYYVQDSNGETLGVYDKAPPKADPDYFIRENSINYPVYVYKPPKPPLVERETVIDSVIHGGLWSIAAAGASAMFGVDVGMTADTGAAVAAGGGIGSLLLFGAKQAAKVGAKLLAERLQGGR
jgi:lysozyme family protein